MKCNIDRLRARIFHGLKSLLSEGDTLPPRFLEVAICESFGLDHVGDGNFYADGVKDKMQASIKTRMMNPHVLKRKQGRDFQTDPAMFLGPKQNKKHNKTCFFFPKAKLMEEFRVVETTCMSLFFCKYTS